jgi:hypothetical protein
MGQTPSNSILEALDQLAGVGSDKSDTPMACADIAEALVNSTFDHTGTKPALVFATENDVQGMIGRARRRDPHRSHDREAGRVAAGPFGP